MKETVTNVWKSHGKTKCQTILSDGMVKLCFIDIANAINCVNFSSFRENTIHTYTVDSVCSIIHYMRLDYSHNLPRVFSWNSLVPNYSIYVPVATSTIWIGVWRTTQLFVASSTCLQTEIALSNMLCVHVYKLFSNIKDVCESLLDLLPGSRSCI